LVLAVFGTANSAVPAALAIQGPRQRVGRIQPRRPAHDSFAAID
jgi:hypothetical protein